MYLRNLIILASLAGLAAIGPARSDSTAPFLEMDVARWGADFQRFAISSGKPEECARACQKNEKCRSWTYVRPGVEGPSAQCRLKTSVPYAAVDPCCVSGIASGASMGLLAGYEEADRYQPALQSAAKPVPVPRRGEGLTASIKRTPIEPRPRPGPASGPPMSVMPNSWSARP